MINRTCFATECAIFSRQSTSVVTIQGIAHPLRTWSVLIGSLPHPLNKQHMPGGMEVAIACSANKHEARRQYPYLFACLIPVLGTGNTHMLVAIEWMKSSTIAKTFRIVECIFKRTLSSENHTPAEQNRDWSDGPPSHHEPINDNFERIFPC